MGLALVPTRQILSQGVLDDLPEGLLCLRRTSLERDQYVVADIQGRAHAQRA